MTNTSQPIELPSEGKVAVVVASYNRSITGKLHAAAIARLQKAGIAEDRIETVWVPGAWEIPLAVKWQVEKRDCIAVVTLGAVIRGDTTHDQHINRAVSNGIMNLSIATSKPIAFGVLTVNNLEQAIARAGGSVGNKGEEAVDAVLEMLKLRESLRSQEESEKRFGF